MITHRQVGPHQWEFDCIEPTAKEKYDYNYERIFGGTMPASEIMHKFKHGTLKSSSGKKVTSRKQAIAIAASYNKKEKSRGKKRSAKRK